MFKYIVLFVAALATILPAVSAVSISVRLGEQDLPLAVGPNEDFVKAAEAFCAQHGISADNVGQLVNALEQEASREMQAQALFHVPVTVDDKTLSMPYYQGTDPVDAARAFAEENGIPTSEDILRQLAQAIVVSHCLVSTFTGCLNHTFRTKPMKTLTSHLNPASLLLSLCPLATSN